MNKLLVKNISRIGIHNIALSFYIKHNIDLIKELDIVDSVISLRDGSYFITLDFTKGIIDIELIENSINRNDVIEINGGYYRVFCKPHEEKKDVCTIDEIVEGVDTFTSIFALGKAVKCNRIDIAYDLRYFIEDNLKIFMYFIELFNIEIKGQSMYRTEKNLFKTGNLKCKNSKNQITVYDCSDKDRWGYIRIEYRNMGISNEYDIRKNLENTVKKYLKILDRMINNYEKNKRMVTANHVELIEKFRKKQMYKNNYEDFNGFISTLEAYDKILTRNILKEIYKKSKKSSKFKKWLEVYRRTDVIVDEKGMKGKREIKLITDREVLNLIKEIKREVKTMK